MLAVDLDRLRKLRAKAAELLRSIETDLRPFLHDDGETFRRKPDSPSVQGDVNVTTTCSCLMALALSNEFRKFYSEDKASGESPKAQSVFGKLVRAPWMSSGLTANNAFTTTLVLRAYGFLVERGLLHSPPKGEDAATAKFRKPWESNFGVRDGVIPQLATSIQEHADPPWQFLYASVSDSTRLLIRRPVPADKKEREKCERDLKATIALDLRRIVQSGWIYDASKFPQASDSTKAELAKLPTGYELARVNHLLLVDQFPDFFEKPATRTLSWIVDTMATDAANFAINAYPTSAAVVYWFIDGIERAGIQLSPERWSTLCNWATDAFSRERSLVLAEHDAMMDPVAMGMAACLCARLRKISEEADLGTTKDHRTILPSVVELEHSIRHLFKKQATSGIWPKYFPLFHYQEAGSNFCFTFELLEAVLCEFGGSDNHLLDFPDIITGLENALTWCKQNHLEFAEDSNHRYTGWNSGGDLQTLQRGQPESWATAVVHMFLWELVSVLSEHIQRKILDKYQTVFPPKKPKESSTSGEQPEKALDKFLDIDVLIQDKHENLRDILKKEFVASHAGFTETALRREKAELPLSALLFGPPGTSKTEMSKAVAEDLGWPLVQINPTEFVKGTLADVYVRAEEIFQDLMDLSAVVIFFDEMDALTQSRDAGPHLDTATQFLTTSMLPKLTDLHDRGRVVFFMATNFQKNFDEAIKRAGRFDFLLCMGPPKLEEKLKRLPVFYALKRSNAETDKAVARIRTFIKESSAVEDALTLYTFGEFRSFLKSIGNDKTIGGALEKLSTDDFAANVKTYTKSVTLRMNDLKLGKRKFRVKDLDHIPSKVLKRASVAKTAIARYIDDRKASRRQY